MAKETQASSTPLPQPVPFGMLLMSLRWQGTRLATLLKQAHVPATFSDRMGVADFMSGSDTAVTLLTERDLQNTDICRARLRRLGQSSLQHKVVIMERTAITSGDFSEMQLLAAFELQLTVLPIGSIEELPQILEELVSAGDRSSPGLLAGRPTDQQLLDALRHVPGLGAKADLLPAEFGSLAELAAGSVDRLAGILGPTRAAKVYEFFHGRHTPAPHHAAADFPSSHRSLR